MSAPLTNFEGDFVGTLIFFSGQKLNFSERVKYPSMGGGGGWLRLHMGWWAGTAFSKD